MSINYLKTWPKSAPWTVRIRVVDALQLESAYIYITVNIGALNVLGGCVANLNVSLQDVLRVALRHKNEGAPPDSLVLSMEMVVYESSGLLFTGVKSDFGDQIMAAVRDQVDSIVTKIKLANQE